MILRAFAFLICLLPFHPFLADAATYYVDETDPAALDTNPGTSALPWLTCQKAANTMVAGDTTIFKVGGEYDENCIPVNSGAAGNLITFTAAAGAPKAKIRKMDMNAKDYIAITNLEFTNQGMSSSIPTLDLGGCTGCVVTDNYIHDTDGIGIRCMSSLCDGLKILRNRLLRIGPAWPGGTGRTIGMQLYAINSEVADSDIQLVDDYMNMWGSTTCNKNVVRGNFWHESLRSETANGAVHIDGLQSYCSAGWTFTCTLLEGNRHINDPDADIHTFLITPNTGCGGVGSFLDTIIIRHNETRNIGSVFLGTNSTGDSNVEIYNNTSRVNNVTNPTFGSTAQVVDNSSLLNNIFEDAVGATAVSKTGYIIDGAGNTTNYNWWWMTTGSVTWASPAGDEANGPAFRNVNPQFVSSTDSNLQAGSGAVDAGRHLTTVHVDDTGTGTTLVLTDAHSFQDGWAGVNPDWIAIGTVTNAVQIAAGGINYSTNTVTLANSIPRSDGQSVWLYKNSKGIQVLWGSAPDLGAYERGGQTAGHCCGVIQ